MPRKQASLARLGAVFSYDQWLATGKPGKNWTLGPGMLTEPQLLRLRRVTLAIAWDQQARASASEVPDRTSQRARRTGQTLGGGGCQSGWTSLAIDPGDAQKKAQATARAKVSSDVYERRVARSSP